MQAETGDERDGERDDEAAAGECEGPAAERPKVDLQAGEEEEEGEPDRREHVDRHVRRHPAEHRWAEHNPGDDLEDHGGKPEGRHEAEQERGTERCGNDDQQPAEVDTAHG